MAFYPRRVSHRSSHRRLTGGTGRVATRSYRPMRRAITNVRNQRPSAYNQKHQIMRNSFQLQKLWTRRYSQRVYTDYFHSRMWTPAVNDMYATRLTDVTAWTQGLRHDTNVVESSKTFCRRMQLSLTYDLGTCVDQVYLNLFLVRVRFNYADFDPTITVLTTPWEFYVNPVDLGAPHVFMNQGIFKVIKSKRQMLTYLPVKDTVAPATLDVGNPGTTHGRLYWDIPLRLRIMNPVNQPWLNKPFVSMPYYDRLYLMCYPGYRGHIDTPPAAPSLSLTCQFTCVNVD